MDASTVEGAIPPLNDPEEPNVGSLGHSGIENGDRDESVVNQDQERKGAAQDGAQSDDQSSLLAAEFLEGRDDPKSNNAPSNVLAGPHSKEDEASSSSSSASSSTSRRRRRQQQQFEEASETFSYSESSWEFTIASSSVASSALASYRPANPRQPLSHLHAEQYSSSFGDGGIGGSGTSSSSFRKKKRKDSYSDGTQQQYKLDFSSLSGQLYGRESQVRELHEAWEEVRGGGGDSMRLHAQSADGDEANPSRGNVDDDANKDQGGPRRGSFAGKVQGRANLARRLVTIRGASGTGKSTLAESMRPTVFRDGGFFLQGKFPQPMYVREQLHGSDSAPATSTDEPYAAFAAACQELCDVVAGLNDTGGNDDDYYDEGSRRSWGWKYRLEGEQVQYGASNARRFRFTRQEFVERLERDVGVDSRILIRVVPRLAQILHSNPAPVAGITTVAPKTGETDFDLTHRSSLDPEPDSSESIGFREGHLQFKFAFRRFVRAITSFGPVCIVLDDLQWADAASVELLEALLSDRENGSLLVVGSYRDDDLYDSLPHLRMIENLSIMTKEDVHLGLVPILVDNLNVMDVNQLVTDLLRPTDAVEAMELAECVHKKTHGNIFFVLQFLSALHQAHLLTYSSSSRGWKWNVTAIQASAEATENVVSLMKTKMRNLPKDTRSMLPILACLGSSFSFTLFEAVEKYFLGAAPESSEVAARSAASGDGESEVDSKSLCQLAKCESEGLIEVLGIDENGVKSYQWVHDKIQEAAFTMIEEFQVVSLKLAIGKALYESLQGPSLEKNLFIVAGLLSSNTTDHPSSLPRQKPIEVANLFLRAGVRSIENSAFEQASAYLLKGIELLPRSHWSSHGKLSHELFSAAAEAEFCTGHFDRMRKLCSEVIEQQQIPLIDKRRVYNVLIDSTGAEERLVDALSLCRDILAKLGCRFPNRAVKMHVVAGILKIKSTLKKTTTPELLARLPTMEDETKMWMMDLVNKFATYAYLSKSDLLPLAIFKGLRLTMNDGLNYISPCMFALVGLSLAAFVGDYKGGVAFADQALQLLKNVKGARKVESRVIFVTHALVLHWLRPLSSLVDPLMASYDVGMSIGDTESASWSIYFHLENSFRIGVPLDAIAADCAYYAAQLKEVKQVKIRSILLNLWQAVLHLTGENPFYDSLSGEIVQQATVLREAKKDFEHLFAGIYRIQFYVAFVLGSHNVVYATICETGAEKGYFEKVFPGIAGLYHLKAFNALSLIALYRETGEKRQLKLAKQFAAGIKSLARVGNPNVPHFDALLDAELASLHSEMYSAVQLYEVAVLFANRLGYVQDHALAHELYGEFLARLEGTQNVRDARLHLLEAIKLYESWGARAKADLMRKKHYQLMQPSREFSLVSTRR